MHLLIAYRQRVGQSLYKFIKYICKINVYNTHKYIQSVICIHNKKKNWGSGALWGTY